MGRLELWGWAVVAAGLCTLTIPWFLWGDATVVAGLPLWLWWHIGWMLLASIVFWLFADRAWGIGIETEDGAADGSQTHGSRDVGAGAGGERR